MSIKYYITDKTRTAELGLHYGALVIAAGATAIVEIRNPREFSVPYFLVGPGSKDYTVTVKVNIGTESAPISGTIKTDAKANTDVTIYQWLQTAIISVYRFNCYIEVKNTGGAESTFYYQIAAFDGPEIPLRKY
jgi:hypothetical protein